MYSLTTFVQALLFVYVSYLAGMIVMRALSVTTFSVSLQRVFAVIAGYGIYILVGFLAGIIGIFHPVILWIVTAIIIVTSLPTLYVHIQSVWSWIRKPQLAFAKIITLFKSNTLLKVIIVAWLAVNFLLVFVPVTAYDTLDYHLPMILDIIRERRLTLTEDIRQYHFLPVFGEILYAVPTAMFSEAEPDLYRIFDYNNTTELLDRKDVVVPHGPFVFQMIQYSVMVLLAIMLYQFLKTKVANSFLPAVGVLLMLSIFDLWREILHSGYIDVFTFLFGLASIFIIIEKSQSGDLSWRELTLSAFFVGIALGIKYISLFFAGINAVLLCIYIYKHKVGYKKALYILLGYAAVAIVIAGFWYVKNAVSFGNPVYPMFSVATFDSVVNEFITERSILTFIIFPFLRYSKWFVDPSETSSRLVVLGFYIFLYGSGIALLLLRRKFSLYGKLTLLSAVILTGLLFLTSHIYRFLIPSVILIIPVMIFYLDSLLVFCKEKLKTSSYVIVRKLSVTALCIAFVAMFIFGNFHYWKIRFSLVTGQISVGEYVHRVGSQ